eukprot:332600-Prorocentrum_minimum.AAC.1
MVGALGGGVWGCRGGRLRGESNPQGGALGAPGGPFAGRIEPSGGPFGGSQEGKTGIFAQFVTEIVSKGMGQEESKIFVVTFPEDYPKEQLRGMYPLLYTLVYTLLYTLRVSGALRAPLPLLAQEDS